jgi:DNA-binding transcriptional regulator YhcF (GntR family)
MQLFHFDSSGGIPAHVQIKEQVKVALALGKLGPGDLLPSIRKVEDELGVGRMLVRKAYQQLQQAGLIHIVHGKGAVVTGNGLAQGHATRRADTLIRRFLAEVRREGLEAVSFSRLFHQRMLAEDHRAPTIVYVDSSDILSRELGGQVQQALGVQVRPMSVAELRAKRATLPPGVQVLVNYYYLEDVRKLLRGRARQVFPVSWDYAAQFIERLRNLPSGSGVLLLFYQASLEQQGTRLAIEELISRVQDRRHVFTTRPFERIGRLESLVRSPFRAIVVSNQIWDRYPLQLERHPRKFWRLLARLDDRSLKVIGEKLGFVL